MSRKENHRQVSLVALREVIEPIARAHRAKNIRVFGSFARGERRQTSDVDLLVDLPMCASVLDIVALKQDLEEALHRKIDVLTEEGLSPYLRERLLRDATPL